MRHIPLAVVPWFCLSLCLSALAQEPQRPAPAAPIAPAAPVRLKQGFEKPVYDEAADARVVVAAAVKKAKQENQRVLIQWGANWCGWCKWLAGTMQSDGKVARELLYEYQVVHVDVGRFDKHMDLAKELGAEFKAIPFLTVLDGDGKALVQQNTEPFEVENGGKQGHDPAKLLAFLKQHEAAPQVAADVLAAAMASAKQQQKRVFLHFGAPWCGWCHRLEDWMAKPEIAALLAKDFIDVKIDNDRMTGAEAVYAAQLAAAGQQAGGIPWFVFLDQDQKQLAHSTGPKGNTGFPYQPEEVQHFVTMLQAAKVNLSDADIQTLAKSLDDNREREKAEAERKKAAREAAKGGDAQR